MFPGVLAPYWFGLGVGWVGLVKAVEEALEETILGVIFPDFRDERIFVILSSDMCFLRVGGLVAA